MKKPKLALLLSLALLAAACGPLGQAPGAGPESPPESESPVSISEPAPEPESASEPEPESSQPEETVSVPNGPRENPDTSMMNPDTALDPEAWTPASAPEDPQYQMITYLESSLTDEEFTSIFYTEEGLGVLTPKVERVKEVVAAYDGPSVAMEYSEVIHSKARLDAARSAYRELRLGLEASSDPLIANSGTYSSQDTPYPGMIWIDIHQMHPALQEFLDTSGYGDCFVVNLVGGDPIVNPDT